MDAKANFPSIIPEEELTEVLVEFYQRGQSEVKALPPPPPFEVTSTVVQTTSSRALPTNRETPPLIAPTPALVAPENEVDFVGTNIAGFLPQAKTFTFDFFFKAHNRDKVVTGPCAIRTYSIYYEVTVQRPGGGQQTIRGPGYANFNGSQWIPPPPDSQGLDIRCNVYFPSIPPPGSQYINGYVFIPMFVEYVDDGTDMDHIYGSNDNPPGLQWYYPPPRSIALYCTIQY